MNSSSSIKSLSAVAALLLGCLAIRAQIPDAEPVPKPVDSVTVADLILKGDACDRKFKANEALQSYLAAEKLEPKNARLLVSIARQYRHLMTDATTREKKVMLGNMAVGYSLRAAALAPNDSEAQLAIGITYAKMLLFQGTKEQVAASGPIKRSADAAIRLDPRNDTAWHILGRWHRNVAAVGGVKRVFGSLIYGSLPKSTNEAAVACFEKAIAINPQRPMHHIELGRTYAEMGKKDDARRLITKGLAMPDTDKDDPQTKQQGRETLTKLH